MGKQQLDQAIAQETRKINLPTPKRIGNSLPIQPLHLSSAWHQRRVLSYRSQLVAEQPESKGQVQCTLEPPVASTSDSKSSVDPVSKANPVTTIASPKILDLERQEGLPVMKPRSLQVLQIPFLLQFQQRKKRWDWLIAWLTVLCIFGGMGTSALLWLTGLPPLPNCGTISPDSGMPRLYCAQQTARSGKLPDLLKGIALLKDWSSDQPFYDQAQELVSEWSDLVLISAQNKIDQNDLKGAIAAATQVPVSSSVYGKAQKAIAAWKNQWHKGNVLYAKAEIAIRTQNWKEAAAQVVEMGYMDHEYWRIQQADALSKRILREKDARQALTQAQKLIKEKNLSIDSNRADFNGADSNKIDPNKTDLSKVDLSKVDPDRLGDAIALVQAVPSGTLAFPEAKTALKEWSQALLEWAMQQWQQGNVDLALNTAQRIPFDPHLPIAGKDLIQLSHAQQQTDNIQQQGLTEQLWNLLEATSAVGKISHDSPVYELAHGRSQAWQARLQDVIQLQYADVLARLRDRASLQTAIAQAQKIAPDRPGRLSAQSLIARWNQELQRVEDRQYLIRAKEMAKPGKVENLKQAIAQAEEIPPNRALWNDAQTQMAIWTKQIEIIEDQPILEQAKSLAKPGKYPEAIQVAEKIHGDRALYAVAQNAIGTWQAQIRKVQTAEDQPILDQANALAARGRLTMAIEMASQIAPNRALSDQAQSSIKIWTDERSAVWNSQAATGIDEIDSSSDGSASAQ